MMAAAVAALLRSLSTGRGEAMKNRERERERRREGIPEGERMSMVVKRENERKVGGGSETEGWTRNRGLSPANVLDNYGSI